MKTALPLQSTWLPLVLCGALAGCAASDARTDDDPTNTSSGADDGAEPASPAASSSEVSGARDTIKIVSANILEGGVWNDSNRRERNWATMDKFVELVHAIDAPVLAVQETVSRESVDRLLAQLDRVTGQAWAKQDTIGAQPWGIATAVYWRTDVVSQVASLGHKDLGKLDSNGYTIRFHGVLLAKKATRHPFAVFTGKLPWTGAAENLRMAPVLRDWVHEATRPYPDAVRVIGMDMNAPHGSPTWKLFDADFDDSGQRAATHPSSGVFALRKRLDYVWADYDGGPKRTGMFLEPVRRSMHFGSDHRFVWGDVHLHGADDARAAAGASPATR